AEGGLDRFAGQEGASDGEEVIGVGDAVGQGSAAVVLLSSGQTGSHAGEDLVEGGGEVSLFEFFEHAVVASVPGVQQGVAGDVHGQVAAVDAVELLGEAGGAQPFADHEAVGLELRRLLGVEAEIEAAAAFAGLVGGIPVEVVPEFGGGGVE